MIAIHFRATLVTKRKQPVSSHQHVSMAVVSAKAVHLQMAMQLNDRADVAVGPSGINRSTQTPPFATLVTRVNSWTDTEDLVSFQDTGFEPHEKAGASIFSNGIPKEMDRPIKVKRFQEPYHCHLCPYESKDKAMLSRHMLTHSGEKSFECPACTRKFGRFESLKDHMHTHSGERPYQCTMCPYRTAHRSTLADHKKRHTTEELLSCDLCPYVTMRRTNLERHVMTHRGEKPYKCNECSYACNQKSNLIRHNILKHARAHFDT
ncbi:uncharacterized protein LOC142564182 isoform X2 [Dermacentor variabilis]|uniref:uncharacterized protein LOC142564182 isoform X2 n=1 Tax=Dermacentor variabilis TaxID=34621 RepID=UPI003F5C127C